MDTVVSPQPNATWWVLGGGRCSSLPREHDGLPRGNPTMHVNNAASGPRRAIRRSRHAALTNQQSLVDWRDACALSHGQLTRRGSAALLAGAMMASAGCGTESAAPPQPPPPQVTVAHPVQRDVVAYQDFTGRTAAVEVVDVRARVSGVLEAVHFTPSTIVRRGDLLFTIERAPYVAARNAAVAAVRTVEATLVRARSDLARLEQAIRTNAVSAQEVDRARADVRQSEANLLGEQARLEQAELELSYTEIRAPLRGLIGRNLVSAGNVVGGAETGTLATIMQIDPMYAYFDVSETLVLEALNQEGVTVGDRSWDGQFRVDLGLADEAGWPHEGMVDFIDNTVDPNTGTIQLRGRFPNPTAALFPGLFARLRVPGPVQADAVLVMERAIGTDLGGKYVLVVGEDDIVELRHISLGAAEGDLRVVTAGLRPDERYVTTGVQRARPGLPVTPMMAGTPAAQPGAAPRPSDDRTRP